MYKKSTEYKAQEGEVQQGEMTNATQGRGLN